MHRVVDVGAEAGRVEVRVSGTAVEVWPWARWQDAVATWRADAGIALARGEAWLADARGRPLDPGGRVVAGAAIEWRDDPMEASP